MQGFRPNETKAAVEPSPHNQLERTSVENTDAGQRVKDETTSAIPTGKNETLSLNSEAMAILKIRLVKGEITPQQFEEMKKVIADSGERIVSDPDKNQTTLAKDTSESYVKWLGSFQPLKEMRIKEALKETEKMIQRNPSDSIAWYGRAVALMYVDSFAEAIGAVDRALSIDPYFAIGWRLKGSCYRELDRFSDAFSACDRALSINPECALSLKASILNRLNRYEEALEASKQAVKIKPDEERGWYSQGVALFYLYSKSEASQCFERAISEADKHLSKDQNDREAVLIKFSSMVVLGKGKEGREFKKKNRKFLGKK